MKQFKLAKAIEVIEIDGDKFEIDLSDDKRKEYATEGLRLQQEARKIQERTAENNVMTEAEVTKELDNLREITKGAMDKVLGVGAFDKIYPKTNRSVVATADVLYQVIDYIQQKEEEQFEAKRSKYVRKRHNNRNNHNHHSGKKRRQ